MEKKIIVCDIDGSIANIEHRQHHVRQKPKRWDLFNKGMKDDTPYDDIVWLFNVLKQQPNTIMLVASGRGEESRQVTVDWLAANGIEYQKLYMRPAKDSRPDYIIKTEILNQIREEFGNPYMVLDDREQVVTKCWRANGIRCLQVKEGDF